MMTKVMLLSLYRCGCPAGREAFGRFMAGRNLTNHKQALRVLIKQAGKYPAADGGRVLQ
jgi:hypothetical protein